MPELGKQFSKFKVLESELTFSLFKYILTLIKLKQVV